MSVCSFCGTRRGTVHIVVVYELSYARTIKFCGVEIPGSARAVREIMQEVRSHLIKYIRITRGIYDILSTVYTNTDINNVCRTGLAAGGTVPTSYRDLPAGIPEIPAI